MDFDGLEIEAPEGVYEPREDSILAARALRTIINNLAKGRINVLDIGTGSGILGLTAASCDNVSSVTMSDINSKALSSAKENFQKNKSSLNAKCNFVKSDLFSNIGGKFDMIIFNAPYLPHSSEDKDMESKAWDGGSEGIELPVKFLKGAKPHMKENGEILLVASSLGNMQKLKREIKEMNLHVEKSFKEHYFFEDISVLVLLNQLSDQGLQ